MKVGIFEPAVGREGRPHHDEVVQVAAALARQGADVTVHAHRSIDEEIASRFASAGARTIGTFSMNDYIVAGREKLSPSGFDEVVNATVRELRGVPDYDLAFWPAILGTQVRAAAVAPAGRRIVLANDGQILTSSRVGVELYAASLALVDRHADRIRFAYFEPRAVEFERHLLGDRPSLILPAPLGGTPRVPRPAGSRPRLGIVGGLRPERGSTMVPHLVKGLLARDCEVVLQTSTKAFPEIEPDPRLTMLPFVEDFGALVASCDAVVWPSLRENYRHRVSGVCWVALFCGVPLVMPSICLPAQIVSEHGVAEYFHAAHPAFVLMAVDRLLADLPARQAEADRKGAVWRSHQGPDNLARALLALGTSKGEYA